MAFLAERLDPRITRGALKTIGGGRIKAYTQSGRLVQNFHRTMLLHRFDVSHGVKSAADFQAVLDLFWIVFTTPYEGFLYKDWSDFRATPANSILTFLSGSTWQLARRHRVGAFTYARPIRKPLGGTVSIQRTRSGVVSAASATLDYTTGIATIDGHVAGDTYTWTGEFDLPVTFTDNEWAAALEGNTNRLWMASQPIKVEELLP